MNKNMILSANECPRVDLLSEQNTGKTLINFSHKMKMPAIWLRDYYSQILGKKISLHQTWLLTETQISFILGAFPADCPWLFRAACGGWLLRNLLKCKKSI